MIAMTAGEADVDYLMFGEPRPDGYVPPLLTTLDQTRWWADIFNVPCVAYAATLDDVWPLVEAGAEFIALGDALWTDPRGRRRSSRRCRACSRARRSHDSRDISS